MDHEFYMQRALSLAKLGWPSVSPNPMVGCVIVKDNKIVSEGYHQKFGEAHAEVNAILNLPDSISPADCTLYVTLEPCSHFGKTPPCADLILRKGFKNVVVGSKDINPLVSGKGIKKLQDSGVTVIEAVLSDQEKKLNNYFIKFHTNKRPFYILKWAITADGFISKTPLPQNRSENIITGKLAQEYVHQLRAEVMAIFVGKNTILNDNPSLTTRLVVGKNPIRIFIDQKLEVPRNYNVYNKEALTIVFNAKEEKEEGHIRYIKLNFEKELISQINEKLYQLQIQSVLVEGGAILLNQLIQTNNFDQVVVFQNPELYFREGLKGPHFDFGTRYEKVGNDKIFRFDIKG
jgi:diaminohydroxyphosphoribosylaminopyrimidine deaminase / 5-amino-6-(5-phosphoribosylamino)uracil reductase